MLRAKMYKFHRQDVARPGGMISHDACLHACMYTQRQNSCMVPIYTSYTLPLLFLFFSTRCMIIRCIRKQVRYNARITKKLKSQCVARLNLYRFHSNPCLLLCPRGISTLVSSLGIFSAFPRFNFGHALASADRGVSRGIRILGSGWFYVTL
jgi:hypothetical protein